MKLTSWPRLAALILVPLLVVGALVGLTSSSGDDRIRAAVVNLDEPVTIDGNTVPLGRQLAAEMVDRDGENVSWTLADESSGAAGLRSGEYSAVVTIPEGFSAAATSFSGNDAEKAKQATIQVQVSDNAPVTDAQLAQQIARIATEKLNSALTGAYLDQVYVGFNTVGEKFVSIVDGANQLHDGTGKLSNGLTEASQGVNTLSGGLGTLASKTPELQRGGDQLASSVNQLDQASGQLATGASKLNQGVGQLAAKAPQLERGVGALASGADTLLTGIPAYTRGASAAVQGAGRLRAGLDQVVVGIDKASTMDTSELDKLAKGARAAADGVAPLAAGAKGLSQGVTAVDQRLQSFEQKAPSEASRVADRVGQGFECPANVDPQLCPALEQAFKQGASAGVEYGFRAGAGAARTMLNTKDPDTGQSIAGGARQLGEAAGKLKGLDQLATGVETLADELPKRTAKQLATLRAGIVQARDGAGKIASEGKPLVDNAQKLSSGATKLNSGIKQLNSQVGTLGDGVNELSDGASKLSAGVNKFDEGVGQLATGTNTYVNGVKQYSNGVSSAAKGGKNLSAGMSKLSAGASKLDSSMGTFASELAKGAKEVPSYSADERGTLSTVVASPVEQDNALAKASTVSMTSLLLVAGLWVGALASFVVMRPVPRNVVASSASTMVLWLRQVKVPAVVGVAQGLVLGLLGWAVMGLSTGRGLGLTGLLVLLGVSFMLANHALAGWLGHAGRAMSLLLLAVTVALGVSSSAGWLLPAGEVSPLHNGFEMLRTWASGGSGGAELAGAALLFGVVALVASVLAIAARRRLTARQFLRAAAPG